MLALAIKNTLLKANELGCETLSMPAISSGIFGFPKPLCAEIFFRVLRGFVFDQTKLLDSDTATTDTPSLALKTVRLCNFDDETCEIFRDEFNKALQPMSTAEATTSQSAATEAENIQ